MSWSTEFAELMPHTVQIAALASFSTDGYGDAVYGTASTFTARVVGKQTLVRTFEGTEELATTIVYVASTGTINPSDRITLPDGSTPPLLAVSTFPDEDGTHHHKLAFG